MYIIAVPTRQNIVPHRHPGRHWPIRHLTGTHGHFGRQMLTIGTGGCPKSGFCRRARGFCGVDGFFGARVFYDAGGCRRAGGCAGAGGTLRADKCEEAGGISSAGGCRRAGGNLGAGEFVSAGGTLGCRWKARVAVSRLEILNGT